MISEGVAPLLLVEDDATFRATLGRALAAEGFRVVAAASAAEGLAEARRDPPAFAVLDLKLPDGSGLALLAELRRLVPELRAVMLTGWGSIATALEAVRLGAVDFLSKPVEVERVVSALRAESATSAPASVPSLDRVEWEHIQRVLVECGGNISAAARLLGIHRRSLQRKLAKRPSLR